VTLTAIPDTDWRDVADRLAAEFSDIPSGSVLRCVARAVHRARMDGLPPELVAGAGEAIARQMLALRRRSQASGVVPVPRRPAD
jgi:hypothetical protein